MPEIRSHMFYHRDPKLTVGRELEIVRGHLKRDREALNKELGKNGLLKPRKDLSTAAIERHREALRLRRVYRGQEVQDAAFLRVLNPDLTLGEVRDAVKVWTDATSRFTSEVRRVTDDQELLFYYMWAANNEAAFALRSANLISEETYDLYCMQADHAKRKIAWDCLPPATAARQSAALLSDLQAFPFKTLPYKGEEHA